MKEQAFLFYQRWREQMKRLPDEERLLVYDAICDYAFEHKTSNLAYYLECILDNIRATIVENQAKQEAFLQLQKEKGRKSAEARKRKKQQNLGSTDLTAVEVGSTESTNNKNKNKNKNKKEVVVVDDDNNKGDDDDANEEKLYSQFQQNQSVWEMLAMKHRRSVSAIRQMLEDFKIECKIRMNKHKDLRDLQNHFADWVRIQITEQEKQRKYDEQHSTPEERERRAKQSVLDQCAADIAVRFSGMGKKEPDPF